MKENSSEKSSKISIVFLLLIIGGICFFYREKLLGYTGEFLVADTTPLRADASVVLCTGVDYYPRLLHASKLYISGVVEKIIINGDRKTDVLRKIEAKGYEPCCPWYENSLRILALHGVVKNDVITINAPDAFDTISEAKIVGNELKLHQINSIIITTSKSHTRRAGNIWNTIYGSEFQIFTSAAIEDPYDPHGWWKEGRQIRWVLSEYGAWAYYGWMTASKKVKEYL